MPINFFDLLSQGSRKVREFSPEIVKLAKGFMGQPGQSLPGTTEGFGEALAYSPPGALALGAIKAPKMAAKLLKTLPPIDRTKLFGRALDVPSQLLQRLKAGDQSAREELTKYLNSLQSKKTQIGLKQPAKDVFQRPRQESQPPTRLLDQLTEVENKRFPKNLSMSPLETRIGDSITDVKKKANLLDYLRTPSRVLEKIGMKTEADLLRQKYDDFLIDLPKQIEKISSWSKQVKPDANVRIFRWLDGKAGDDILSVQELGVAKEIKSYLKNWAGKLKLPEDKQISDYITHLFPKGAVEKEFPEEIAKLIHGRVVKSVYDPFLQKRVNKPEYLEDTWEALSAYTKTATRKFHMDQALEQVAKKAETLPLESYNYVKGRISRINMQPMDIDNLLDNLVKSSPLGYKYGQRPTATITRNARQMVFRGLLGLNPGSVIRNLQQTTNTYAVLGERSFLTGAIKTIQNLPRYISGADSELEKVGVLGKDILQDRNLNAVKKFWETADKPLFYMFNFAEKINRSIAYFGAKSQAFSKGLNEEEAVNFAKGIVRKTQFNYDVIDTPAALQSDIAKTIFQFGKYPLAQTEFLVEMAKSKNIAGSVRWLAANLLFIGSVGKILGLAPKDMFPQFRFGTPPTAQLPVEAGKAALGVPDKYGDVPEGNPLERVLQSKEVRRGLINYIPAGGQLKKSLEATANIVQGGSMTPSGGLRYPAPSTNFGVLQSLLFGSYATKEARKYYKEDNRPLSEEQTKQVQAGRSYDDVQIEREIKSLKAKIKKIAADPKLSERQKDKKIEKLEIQLERRLKLLGE